MCQDYPAELEDLTLTEEYAIARCHPIGTILKLKPNGLRNPTAYNGIRGHIVTIPQNPGPLLDILPSPNLQFHDHIRIVWTGKKEPCNGVALQMHCTNSSDYQQTRPYQYNLRLFYRLSVRASLQ